MKRLSQLRSFTLVCLMGAVGFLSGCSADMNLPDTQGTSDFGTVRGGVYGGQQPITAAQIYVFETPSAGTPGYGNTAPVSLIGHAGSSVTCSASVALPIVYNATAGICSYQTGGSNAGGSVNPNFPAPSGSGPATLSGDGLFNLTGIYKCDVGQDVWLYGVGGYPIRNSHDVAVAANFNKYATLMADLGKCTTGDFHTVSFIYMNELSTVAMAYAVAGFAGDTSVVSTSGINTQISSPSSNSTGLNNAFANAQQLYSIFGPTGGDEPDSSAPQKTTYGTKNGIPPYYLINTIGDVLAGCINSTGNATTISSTCKDLFVDIYGNSSPPITDTASAAIYLAKHPNNADPNNLESVANVDPVWLPNYASGGAPIFNDFTASISYANGSYNPEGVVTDSLGNAFLNDYSTTGYMIKVSPLGAVTTTAGLTPLLSDAATIAIDSTGLIWAPNSTNVTGDGYIYEVSNTTSFTSVTRSPATGGSPLTKGKVDPIAADGSGFVYVADPTAGGGEIYKTDTAGSTTIIVAGTVPGSHGCVTGATDVAVDGAGLLWVTGTGTTKVCRISANGTANDAGDSTHAISNGSAVAVDANDSAWVLDESNENLHKVTTGSVTSGPYSSGGLSGSPACGPVGLTVDGAGNIWTINDSTTHSCGSFGSISEINGSNGAGISDESNAFQYGNLIQPKGISIDISGDVWVANYGGSSIVEVIGAAAPTNAYSVQKPGTKP
jgi:hypothetical protein